VIVGGALLALSAWSLGGVLGPPDPKTVADTAELGTVIEGALGLRALGVLCAPLLTALTTLALLVASSHVDDDPPEPASPEDRTGVPQHSW
jgi:hypothetical protein